MTKEGLLKSIAQTGYNVGFGAKKHFTTYDFYRVVPKLFSILVLFFGVFQLTSIYKTHVTDCYADTWAILLIFASLIALVVDLRSKNLEEYNRVGKELQEMFNTLRMLYNEVKDSSEGADFTEQKQQVVDIEKRVTEISLSEQAILTHIVTNIRFFNESQIYWLNEQLHFKFRDKFPIFHLESFVLYGIILTILYGAIYYGIRIYHCH